MDGVHEKMSWQEESTPDWRSQAMPAGSLYDPTANSISLPEGMKPQDKALMQAPEAENTWEAVQGAMQGSATGMTVKAAIAKIGRAHV